MPIFDFRCKKYPSCEGLEVDVFVRSEPLLPICPVCGEAMEKIFVSSTPVHIFREGLYPNLGLEPVYVKSKRQLRAECRERGLTMDYAE
jgi:hypothetical protein